MSDQNMSACQEFQRMKTAYTSVLNQEMLETTSSTETDLSKTVRRQRSSMDDALRLMSEEEKLEENLEENLEEAEDLVRPVSTENLEKINPASTENLEEVVINPASTLKTDEISVPAATLTATSTVTLKRAPRVRVEETEDEPVESENSDETVESENSDQETEDETENSDETVESLMTDETENSESQDETSFDWIIESGSLKRCLYEAVVAETLDSKSILIIRTSEDLVTIDPRKYVGANWSRTLTDEEIDRLRNHTQIDITDEILRKFMKIQSAFNPTKKVYEFVGKIFLRVEDTYIISTPNGDNVAVRCENPIISFIPRTIPDKIFRLVVRKDGTTFRKNVLATPSRDEFHTDFISTDRPGKSKMGSLRLLHPFHLPNIDNPILAIQLCVFALERTGKRTGKRT